MLKYRVKKKYYKETGSSHPAHRLSASFVFSLSSAHGELRREQNKTKRKSTQFCSTRCSAKTKRGACGEPTTVTANLPVVSVIGNVLQPFEFKNHQTLFWTGRSAINRQRMGLPGDLATSYRSHTDYIPTMYRAHTEHIPTIFWPHADSIPTIYRQHTDRRSPQKSST